MQTEEIYFNSIRKLFSLIRGYNVFVELGEVGFVEVTKTALYKALQDCKEDPNFSGYVIIKDNIGQVIVYINE